MEAPSPLPSIACNGNVTQFWTGKGGSKTLEDYGEDVLRAKSRQVMKSMFFTASNTASENVPLEAAATIASITADAGPT